MSLSPHRCFVPVAVMLVSLLAPGAQAVAGTAPGHLVWADLLTSGSPAEIAPFYVKVFGWTTETVGEGRDAYIRFSNRDQPVAGVAHRPGESRGGMPKTRWLGFLSVADLGAATERATSAGATVLIPARSWQGLGQQVVLTDPEGATFGLLAGPDEEDPSAVKTAQAGVGEWAWPALLADDPFQAANFYGALLECQVTEDRRTPMFAGDLLLTREGRAQAGVVALPGRNGKRPGWLWFVRVADLDATVREVEKQGGRALREPGVDLIGGRLAVVSDPYGAVFGLVEIPGGKSATIPATRP